MIAVDTSILVYAHRVELPQHRRAHERLVALAESDAQWAIPVFCLGEFLRVITHARLFDPPYDARTACAAVERLLESPSLRILVPGPRFPSLLLAAVCEARVEGNLVFDAQIVALCREGGVRKLLTEDRDFARFRDFEVEGLS